MSQQTKYVVVMGVSGSGKSTIGQALAEALGWSFADGDDFHPPANIAKMAAGLPLSDEDRWPWLTRLHDHLAQTTNVVLACSALRQTYRALLLAGLEAQTLLVYLDGRYDLIAQRLQNRPGHFMKPDLLASQFATLEKPAHALTVDIESPIADMVQTILSRVIADEPRNI